MAWAKGAGLMGGTRKVAIVAGDRASDQTALKDYLLPDLKRAGIPTPMIETIPANPSDTAVDRVGGTSDRAAPAGGRRQRR